MCRSIALAPVSCQEQRATVVFQELLQKCVLQ